MALMTLQEMRDHTRLVLDLDISDMPDIMLDRFIKDSYARVIRSRKTWPHLEAVGSLSVLASTQSYALPTATSQNGKTTQFRHLVAVMFRNRNLEWVDQAEMLRRYQYNTLSSVSDPPYYSMFNRKLFFWPVPNTAATATIYGIREPDMTWLSSGAGTPDVPEFYDTPMMSWVLSQMAKQQNDTLLAQNFAQDFEVELNDLNGTEISNPMAQPIVMNGGTNRVASLYPWYAGTVWP